MQRVVGSMPERVSQELDGLTYFVIHWNVP